MTATLLKHVAVKSGGNQWRRQDLVSGGTTIDAPKAQALTRQRRRVESGMGRGVTSQPTRGFGERRELPGGVWGGAPATIAQGACGSKKNTVFLPKLQNIRKNWYFI